MVAPNQLHRQLPTVTLSITCCRLLRFELFDCWAAQVFNLPGTSRSQIALLQTCRSPTSRGEWRTLVVCEDLVLHNVHRLAQHAFNR